MIFLFLYLTSSAISRSIHVAADGVISHFSYRVECHCIYVPQLLYPFLCQWILRLFHVKSTAVNTGVHVSFQIVVFIFSEYAPRAGIAG